MRGKKYAVPGDLIAEGKSLAPGANAYKLGNGVYSMAVGIVEIAGNRAGVVPLEGKYVPRQDDIVVGIVIDYNAIAWTVDINSIFYGSIFVRDLVRRGSREKLAISNVLNVGDVVAAKILSFSVNRDPLLSLRGPGLGRITEGEIIRISPRSVPRLLDRRERLYKLIEDATGCKLIIGMNGLIVVSGTPDGVLLAAKALKLVESEPRYDALVKAVRNALNVGEGKVGEADR
jgi:exosome complex component RRP4